MSKLLSKKIGKVIISGDIVPQYVQNSSTALNKVINSFSLGPGDLVKAVKVADFRKATPDMVNIQMIPDTDISKQRFVKVFSQKDSAAATIEDK